MSRLKNGWAMLIAVGDVVEGQEVDLDFIEHAYEHIRPPTRVYQDVRGSLQRCIPPTCANGMKDGAAESDIDCGGVCLPCPSGNACMGNADCASNVCKYFICQLPTCDDNEKNDGETDTDCGAVCKNPPKLCDDGQGCKTAADCESNVCWAGACQAPTCTDGVQNQGEAGVDCGEPCDTDC